MKKSALYLLILLFLLPGICFAGGKHKSVGAPPTLNLVSAVDAGKLTITITNMKSNIATTYSLTNATTVEIRGKKAALKDIMVGHEVRSIRVGDGMQKPQVVYDLDLVPGPKAKKH